jgi:8-oxo-dGTP pyrophosphatase MutT (NUDIX family)
MDLIAESEVFSFVEQMLDPYVAFRQNYPYTKVLGLFLDAGDQTDFIDVRAIKTVVLMEAIKALVLERHPLPPMIATKSKAKSFAKKMRAAVREAAEELGITQASTDTLVSKLSGFSHHTFRQYIEHVQELLHIKVDRNAVTHFIAARNRLIHDATFLHLAEPGGKHGFRDHAHEYFSLLAFVDRFILRLIGYRGAYLDRSSKGGAEAVPAEQT